MIVFAGARRLPSSWPIRYRDWQPANSISEIWERREEQLLIQSGHLQPIRKQRSKNVFNVKLKKKQFEVHSDWLVNFFLFKQCPCVNAFFCKLYFTNPITICRKWNYWNYSNRKPINWVRLHWHSNYCSYFYHPLAHA